MKEFDTAEFANLGAQTWVDLLKYNFEESGNPFFVWESVRLSKEAGVPIPVWTYKYLHVVAENLLNQQCPKDALLLNPGRGGSPPIDQFQEAQREDEIGMAVENRIGELLEWQKHGPKGGVKDAAYGDVADEYGIAKKTVGRFFKNWKKKKNGF